MNKILTALSLVLISMNTMADDVAIIKSLKQLGAEKVEVKPSPVKGLKTAITDQGILYVSEDGKYVLQGKLYELNGDKAIDVSSSALMGTLESYKNEMIVYPAKNEKHVVTVFMDITCGYCHKLHSQIKEYNDLGITMRYLAFPRKGMDKTAEQMEAIFTAKDNAYALNEAEKGNLPQQLKTPNIVKKHYELGIQFGVRGTPSIVTSNGEMIGGYMSPKELLAALES
ncbi:MAG: bifunctional protein-disulfide isomerase/oxidoreductase DsbC [[Actinobacillus] rossii]|nr:bifunctional protein-disulfide isomerase/oxidoreductase DsbC [[Actinobacillus] rossii]MDY5792598.1 bifunctional protein-disulfide isomerase/oxidoreductase DsbC [[Actinobacillus] rossii]